MCSFACLYPVINIFLVWSRISWSAELKAVVEPQGDCFVCQLQVSRLAHFIIYWPETTSSVIIGYQPKNGTNSLHHGCSLVLLLLLLSPWYCASSPLIKLPLEPRQTHPKWPRTAPGRVHLAHLRNCRCSHWLQPWPHPLLPLNGHLPADSHTQGVCIRMIALGPGIGLREGAALFCGQKHSTVALWPSSGNNDTAEPIDISRDVDTAAATSPQWHSMALLRGHDVLPPGFFFLENSDVYRRYCLNVLQFFIVISIMKEQVVQGKTFHFSCFRDNLWLIMTFIYWLNEEKETMLLWNSGSVAPVGSRHVVRTPQNLYIFIKYAKLLAGSVYQCQWVGCFAEKLSKLWMISGCKGDSKSLIFAVIIFYGWLIVECIVCLWPESHTSIVGLSQCHNYCCQTNSWWLYCDFCRNLVK